MLGNSFAVTPVVGGAGLAPRSLWICFPPTSGKRSCLSFAGPLRFFQLPFQPLVLFAQPFPFLPQLLVRSEEHTSELQSRVDLVCRLLLEKKNIIAYVEDARD